MKLNEDAIVIHQPLAISFRQWGVETLIACGPGYIGKILTMQAGRCGGLQLHREKHETEYVYLGVIKVEYGDGSGKLVSQTVKAGMAVRIPPGVTHRVTALTDAVIFEASTRHFSDRVRMEKVYGETDETGLPTTDHPALDPEVGE